jgi:hypothetical protein
MRLGMGLLASGCLSLAGCSDGASARLAAEWGCGAVEGLEVVSGDRAPDWLLIGELTETREAPAAVAEIACNLATDGRPLFVGVPRHLGGDSDAEVRMRAQLDALIGKGALLIVELISYEDHPHFGAQEHTTAKARAQAITAKVSASGADRALLLLARANVLAQPLPGADGRFSGYSPMPLFLEGEVVSLQVAGAPDPSLSGPAIRMHAETTAGVHGELVLHRMTRPLIGPPPDHAIAQARVQESSPDEARMKQLADEIQRDAQAQAQQLLANDPVPTLLPRETDPAPALQPDPPN